MQNSITHNSLHTRFLQHLCQPILAPLLQKQNFSFALLGATALHGVAVLSGYTLYECPLLATTGVPCPGCGLSRGMTATLRADWREVMAYHAFAPYFLVGIVFTAIVTALPQSYRHSIISWVEAKEIRTGFSSVFLILFVFYWLLRLAIFQKQFITLILLY